MRLFSLVLAAAAAIGALAQDPAVPDPSINTPTGVIQCLPVQLTFSGSAPPFIISVVYAGETGAAPLLTCGTTSENVLTWNANLPTIDNYTVLIRDANGRMNGSAPFKIYPNTSSPTPTCDVVTPTYGPAPVTSAPPPASEAPASTPAPTPSPAPASSPAPAIRGRVVVW
ncbi:hypothetical protein FRC01_004146 [Tulasnella sp. 417]|nr:hypothetical protein FRC01_004146 [Tulasnella sp. 417]